MITYAPDVGPRTFRIVNRTAFPEVASLDRDHAGQLVLDPGTMPEDRATPAFFGIDPAVKDAEAEAQLRFDTFAGARLSASFAISLPYGQVLTDGFFVADQDGNLLADSFRAHGMIKRYGFDEIETRVLTHAHLGASEFELETAAVIGIQTNLNYFHWMLEALPRLLLLEELALTRGATILVPELRPWMAEMIDLVSTEAMQFVPYAGGVASARQLIMPGRGLSNIHTFTPHAMATLDRLRSRAQGRSDGSRRLFVSRTQSASRRIVNEEEIFEIAARHGFERVYPEMMTVEDQICLFRDAEIVAGPLGAGLTNAGFMTEGSALIEFAPEQRSGDACLFSNLAHHRKLRFAGVVGAVAEDGRAIDRRDFYIPRNLAIRAFESCA